MLEQEVDVAELWRKLLGTCAEAGAAAAGGTVDAMQGNHDAVSESLQALHKQQTPKALHKRQTPEPGCGMIRPIGIRLQRSAQYIVHQPFTNCWTIFTRVQTLRKCSREAY